MIAGGSTIIAMLCGIPAAYALARMKFKGQTAFLGFVIVSQMFAPVVLLIGIYQVMQRLGLRSELQVVRTGFWTRILFHYHTPTGREICLSFYQTK